jgi:hypothetical protein
MHAGLLTILEKLDANHRELLAALEPQVTRINALEAGLAGWTSAPGSRHAINFGARNLVGAAGHARLFITTNKESNV